MLGLDMPSHWLIIVLVALVLFGYKQLPEAARSLGRSLRIFRTEMRGLESDDAVRTPGEPAGSAEILDTANPA
jgi:sec-independent protein translocase protein TatA